MLRLIFVAVLAVLFVVPIYKLLMRRTVRIRSELEDENRDAESRFAELKQKQKKLKADCSEEERAAIRRAKAAEKIKKSI